MKHHFPIRTQCGQGLVEAVVVIPVFGALLLGIFQGILLYHAKATLDYATLMAARSGATHFAEPGPMLDGLAHGLLPLYTHQTNSTAIITAYAKAKADLQLGQAASINIISPTQAAFADFKQPEFDGVNAIPNDSLPFRGNSLGPRSHLTVQDANLLKIKVTYQYPLIVPVIDRLIGHLDLARSTAGHKVYSIGLQAQATVCMQTPIRDPNLLPTGTGGNGGNQKGNGSAKRGNGSGGGQNGSPQDSGGSGNGSTSNNIGGGSTGDGNNGGGSGNAGHPTCTAD